MSQNSSYRGKNADGKPRTTNGGTTPKLKDSCTACAYSKLKCSKEKPICSRCEQRGLACEYEASRRTGRRSHATKVAMEQRQEQNQEETPQQNAQQQVQSSGQASALATAAGPAAPVAQMLPIPDESTIENPLLSLHTSFPDFIDAMPLAESQQFADFSKIISGADMPGAAPTKQTQGLFGGDVDSTLPSLASLEAMEVTSDVDSWSRYSDDVWSNTMELTRCSSSVSDISQNSMSDDVAICGPHCQHSIEPMDCCFSMAIGLVTRLASNTSSISLLATVDSTIADNRRIFCEVIKILQCQCSQDGYLLATIALMVFKVIAWYAAIPRDLSSKKEKTGCNVVSTDCLCHSRSYSDPLWQSSSSCSNRFDQGRDPAQLVLSELHLVQSLVNNLSQRIQELRMRSPDANSRCLSNPQDHSAGELNGVLSLSSPSLDQLEIDLRKRLRDVCALLRQDSLIKFNGCRTAATEGVGRPDNG